jgi:hypothetical protein
VFAPRLDDYTGARPPSKTGDDELLKSLMNPSDRAQLVDTLASTLYEDCRSRATSSNVYTWVIDRLENIPPIHPLITALCAVGIQLLTESGEEAKGSAIHDEVERNLLKYLRLKPSRLRSPALDLMKFMQLTTDLANEVFQNHVVGISISHSVPRGGALQLYVNRSVRIG